jgi:MerR family mercuric resistance operon transcriptional regulator
MTVESGAPVEERFTIGGLARAADVPASTVRYYERVGLLRPSRRNASNYRLYILEDLQRLRFIRAAQASGFTLRDVRKLLRPAPPREVQALIAERLARVDAGLRDLRRVREVLSDAWPSAGSMSGAAAAG